MKNSGKYFLTGSPRLMSVIFILALWSGCSEKKLADSGKIDGSEIGMDSMQAMVSKLYGSETLAEQRPATITIGNQEWMTHNLDTDTFRNGDPIPHARTADEWLRAGIEGRPAWCHYLENECLGEFTGKLYNFFTIEDPRGLAPDGWHVATDEDWNRMERQLGVNLGDKLKSATGWLDGGNGKDEVGFDGRPGGMRYYDGTFLYYGHYGFWWTSSDVVIEHAHIRHLIHDYGSDIFHNKAGKRAGLSVRCVKNPVD